MLPIIYMSACFFSCKNIDQDNQVSKSISMMLMSVCANVYIFYLFCSFLSIINTSERHIFFLQFFFLFYFFFYVFFWLILFHLIDTFRNCVQKTEMGKMRVLQKRVKKRSQFWNEKKSMMFYYFLPNIDRNGNRSNKHKNCK